VNFTGHCGAGRHTFTLLNPPLEELLYSI